jgi:hypothetical protein
VDRKSKPAARHSLNVTKMITLSRDIRPDPFRRGTGSGEIFRRRRGGLFFRGS